MNKHKSRCQTNKNLTAKSGASRQVATSTLSLSINIEATDVCLQRKLLSEEKSLHTKPHTNMSKLA